MKGICFVLYILSGTQTLTDILFCLCMTWEKAKVEKVRDMKMIPRENIEASFLPNHLSVLFCINNTFNGNNPGTM